MRDIGLYIMAQNDADLLTDNLQALREDLTYSNDESGADLARRLRHGLQKVGALLSSAHKARSVIVPKQHVLSTFELPGTMLPGNSISDAVNNHVATILEEEKSQLTVLCNMKVGELLSLACERAFISPSVLDHGRHMGEWQKLLLDTAKELSDLSQKIALSATSADLVEQELRGCRKRERESRFKDVRGGRSFHSAPFQPPVVGSPEADGGMVSDALQGIGMVHDAPPLDYAQVVHNCRTRSSKRVMGSGAAHSSKRGGR